jgi:3-deoxy-D-manno-octulosonic-acid transferase
VPKPTALHRFAAFVAALYLHLVGRTSFVETWDHPSYLPYRRKKIPMIFGFWHNSQVFLSYHHRNEPINIMVSQSKDGEYIAQVMDWMGMTAIRGSSSRGGLRAFVEIIQRAKAGEQIGFTPDGPRGPAHSVQSGVVLAAQKTGIPIVPLHTLSRRRLVFNSWDKFMVPLPFSTMIVSHGRPFVLKEKTSEEKAKEKVRALLDKNEEACIGALAQTPSYGQSLLAVELLGLYNVFLHAMFPLWMSVLVLKYGFKRSFLGMGERLGLSHPSRPSERRVWFHAASLGEWQALKPLLTKMAPTKEILITTSSPEARDLIRNERPDDAVHLVPSDLPWIVGPWIRRWAPEAVFIVETELWPNLMEACYKAFIPIFVVNGRISNKSVRGWSRARPLMSRLLRHVSWFYVRTDEDAARFKSLGAPSERVQVTGNLKVDNLIVLSPADKKETRRRLWGSAPGTVIVAGSTWGDEEDLILNILEQPGCEHVRLVIAPRRAERFDSVAKLIEGKSISFDRWSKIRDDHSWTSRVLLVDTLGDLKKMYEAGDVAFIGGSFVKKGGQNPLEAASPGNPLVFGASMENFASEARHLVAGGGAFQGENAVEILSSLAKLARDAALRRHMGEKAAHVVESGQGVANRIYESIREQMEILK